MAMQFDSGGWKPQYDYSAFLSGEQNSLAEQAAREDITKSALGNLLSAGKMPNEFAESNYNGKLAQAKMDDVDYIRKVLEGYKGQMDSQIAAGTTAMGLQPFKQRAEQAELEGKQAKDTLFGNMYRGIQKQHDQSLDPNLRVAGGQGAYFLADTLSRVDPKVMANERQLGAKIESAEGMQEARLAAQARVAGMKKAAVAGDKNAQQALVSYWKQQRDAGAITDDEYAAEIASIFNVASAPKIQPGTMLNTEGLAQNAAEGTLPVKEKPPAPTYAPGAASGKQQMTDPLGIR